MVCYLALQIKFALNFDDALDVVAVHLVGGILGSLLTGVFSESRINPSVLDGLFFGGGFTQLIRQTIAVVVAFGFSFIISFVLLKLVDAVIGLRITEAEERRGLDISLHEEQSYALTE